MQLVESEQAENEQSRSRGAAEEKLKEIALLSFSEWPRLYRHSEPKTYMPKKASNPSPQSYPISALSASFLTKTQ